MGSENGALVWLSMWSFFWVASGTGRGTGTPNQTTPDLLQVSAVRDLMQHLDRSYQLLVMTCWPPTFRYKLWVAMQEPTPISVRFASSVDARQLPWHDQGQHQTVVLVDLTCPGTDRLLEAAGQLLYYRLRWILFPTVRSSTTSSDGTVKGWTNCTDYETLLQHLPLLVSNELFYFCTDPATRQQFVRQQYQFSTRGPSLTTVETYGRWEPTRGLVLNSPRRPTSVRRQNLHQFRLRASIVILHNQTRNHLDDVQDKHIDTITRVNYQLTKSIAIGLNASLAFTFVDNWGYRNSTTGLFNGMIGELQADRADLGGTALFFTQDRIREIDYLSMTTPTRAKFVFRAPKLSFTDNVFLLPFDQYVWYCTISFIVLSGFLLAVMLRTEWRYGVVGADTGPRPRLSDALLNVFGTTCQQGSFIEPRTPPARCLILLSLVVLMFLYASYSANIVALIQSPSTKIQTVEDLSASRLKTYVVDTVYNRYYFKHETEPVRKAMYERKIRNKDGTENFLPLEQGVELIRRGHYAFHVELGVCYKIISETFQEEEKCGLQEIEFLKIIDPYYAIPKNSSFREPVRATLFRLREFGIQGRENTLLYSKKPPCIGGSSYVPVSIVDVWPALLTLGWGYLLTVALFVGEALWPRMRARMWVPPSSG